MSQLTPTPLNQLLRLLLTYLVSIRQASWPARVESDSSHAIGMLSGAYVLGHLDRQQVNRLESLIYSAATNRNRELSLRLLPYGRRFPVRRGSSMSRYILPEQALTLLQAQLNLNGRFTHSLRSAYGGPKILFALNVERGEQIGVTVELGGQRHSTTLPDNSRNSACLLADYIDAIANGRVDSAAIAPPHALPSAERDQRHATMDETLAALVRQGGFITLEAPHHQPVEVAVHTTTNRQGITAILRMGSASRCWTVYGAPEHCQRLLQSSLEALTSPQLAA